MPSLFDEYRTLLELLDAVVDQRIKSYGGVSYVTRGELHTILATAIAQVKDAEAKSA